MPDKVGSSVFARADPWDDESGYTLGRSHRVLAITVISLFVVCCALAAMAWRSAVLYGTAAPWDLPNRINLCGRRFYPAGPVTGTHESLAALDSRKPPWKTAGWTFGLRRIEGPIASSAPCTMTLYIATGDNKYEAYGISGGP